LETEPDSTETVFLIITNNLSFSIIVAISVIIVLLILSALISASEAAFFSLSPNQKSDLQESKTKRDQLILALLNKSEQLSATILIFNTLTNISITITSSFIVFYFFYFSEYQSVIFIVQAILVTFAILLFGETLPKVYAARYCLKIAKFAVFPLNLVFILFSPISLILMKFSNIAKKKLVKNDNFSIDDLSKALDFSDTIVKEDKKILKGIATFRNYDAKAIMKPRMDVVSIDYSAKYSELIRMAVEEGFSRIPVYENSFDNIRGIIYVKDLLPNLQKNDDFIWQNLIREAFFIPETKKINILLEEFRIKKIHFAIVIDEYGGSSGIVTLEDILEEILGEIQDEMDEDEGFYSKIAENIFIFDAKTSLNDFVKITQIDEKQIGKIKGDAETLAGLILEIKNEIPKKEEEIHYNNIKFKILEVDARRIIKIKVILD